MTAGSVSGLLLCPSAQCIAWHTVDAQQVKQINEAAQSNGKKKKKKNLGMVFTSVGSSCNFMILISNQGLDFGHPCLRGGLQSAAIPVLCGNPKSLK